MSVQRTERYWTCEVKAPQWLIIPSSIDDDWTAYASEIVQSSIQPGLEAGPTMTAEGIESISVDALSRLVQFSGELPSGNMLVAAVGVAGGTPVPVQVTVALHDPANPADLLAACGGSAGNFLHQPWIEYPESLNGDVLKVTRIEMSEDGQLWISIALARRTDNIDTLLVWRSDNLSLFPLMTDRIEELLPAIRVSSVA